MGNSCTVDDAVIDFTDTGSGPVVVFVHGVYVGGAIWQRVVAALGGGRAASCRPGRWVPICRSVAMSIWAPAPQRGASWPFSTARPARCHGGGQRHRRRAGAGRAGRPSLDVSRIASLVFTNCDSYEHFPPGQFKLVVQLCRRSPAVGRAILAMLASPVGQKVFLRAVCRTRLSAGERAELFGAFLTNTIHACASRHRHRVVGSGADPAGGRRDPALRQAGGRGVGNRGQIVSLLRCRAARP